MEEINDAEIEDQIIPDEQQEKKEVEEEEAIPVTSETLPLTAELISQNLSLIARTAVGLSHAYTRLELHEKEITNLNAIAAFPHLRYIDCSDNNLVNIEALSNLEYLLSLNLQNNFISQLPASLDKFKYLQHVNLAKNKLKDFTITTWPMLSFLNLNENKLTENVGFEDFPELLHLELRGNKLKTNPKLSLPKLQRLYLAANEIASLKFPELPHLQVLNLRQNKLTNLDGLDRLSYLTQNKIETMDQIEKLQRLHSLRILVLIENPIEQIENYRLEILNRLSKLDRLDKEQVLQEEREEAAVYNPKPIDHQ
ncbi:Leucine-rich repeat-containing protein 23 [Boothiomyces sp. JEL0866]|nr:Leucine-rich repeat-containing protein 23 [Boothiomyces sp. JEL0866]